APPTSEGSPADPGLWTRCSARSFRSAQSASRPAQHQAGPMLLWVAVLLSAPCVGKKALLTLQAQPHPVFEGDVLTLRCQGRKHAVLSHVRFHKDGSYLQSSEDDLSLTLGTATAASSGQYSCAAQVTSALYVGTQTSGTNVVRVQELFTPPALSAIPFSGPRVGSPLTLRCHTKLHPQRKDSTLLFSFYKGGQTLKDRGHHPELHIPEAQEEHSGLYWCKAALGAGPVQKYSPQLEIRVWGPAPVSCPLFTLRPQHASLAVGDVVELLCEAKRGTPPILYTFYLDGKILGNRSAPHGGVASLLFPVLRSRLPPPAATGWFLGWLCVALLGVVVTAAALLGYFTPWRKNGPLPSQNPPPAPGEEQDALYVNVRYQNENDEGIIYSEVCIVPK
ncbi:hypothetical protein MC885_021860, partial [Smutsia gigantea]